MQFGIIDVGPPFIILAIVIVLPIVYLIIRLNPSSTFRKRLMALLAVTFGDIMALLYFVFRLSIMPDDSDKAYWLALGFASWVLGFGMASDWVFRVRNGKTKSRKKK
jgi:hypothetical protein